MSSTPDTSPLSRLHDRPRDKAVLYTLLVAGGLLWMAPLINMVRQSVRFGGFSNYSTVLTTEYNGVNLVRAFGNSLVIAAITTILTCTIGALAGYAFSKIDFPGRNTIFLLSLLFLTVPAVAILVPVYSITGSLHLFNLPLGVALPEVILTLPFAILLLRNYADGIPREMIDAARMDGAGHWSIFRRIFLPLAPPALINLAALCVVWSVQDFLFPTLLLSDPSATTAAQAVQTIKGAFGPTPEQQSQYFAALTLLAVPAILIVVLGIRYLTQGITAGGVKE